MAPLTPSFSIAHVTDLILQQYLSTTTGITDWLNFNDIANIAPRDDGEFVYAGCIWPISLESPNVAYKRISTRKILWGIRLAMAHTDDQVVSSYCLFWADILNELLEAASTTTGQYIVGANLAGTYNGVVVPPNTNISLVREPWSITIDSNESGGAVGMVQSRFTVES